MVRHPQLLTIVERASASRPSDPKMLPDWAVFLGDCFSAAFRKEEPGTIPFDNILMPLVRMADQRLGPAGALSPAARASLTQALLIRLAGHCAETLSIEFHVYRATRNVSAFAAPGSREQYLAFSAAFDTQRYLTEYPVLARLAGQMCLDWIDRTREFLRRLEEDRDHLGAIFGPLGAIAEIQPDQSDFHHRGRAVFLVRFESGLKLAYKPRGLAIDRAFAGMQEWVNTRVSTPLRILKLLDRETHGWVEFVTPEPCADRVALERFYHRAGILLGLAHFLDGTDFHYENLIAAGEQPVLIDLETLCQHRRKAFEEGNLAAARELFETVIRTQLLPRWERGPKGRVFDISGIAGTGGQDAGFQASVWRDVNTDTMRQTFVPGSTGAKQNLPTLDGGAAVNPGEFTGAVEAGFREIYALVLGHKEELLAPGGPIDAFANCRVRFIARGTENYGLLLGGACKPRNLRDAAAFANHFAVLRRVVDFDPRAAYLLPLAEDEIASLERLDIPRLTARPASAVLDLENGGSVAGHFQRPSLDAVRELIANASRRDLEHQVLFIRASMFTRFAVTRHAAAPAAERSAAPSRLADPEEFTGLARRIFEEMRRCSIRAANGSASFIAVCSSPGQTMQLQPLGPALYEGLGGVALFLSALARITGGDEERALALAALMPVRDLLDEPGGPAARIQEFGLGGCTGWGSMIYSLLRCASLLGESCLLEDAVRFASCLTPKAIAADNALDIVGGSAGLLLTLLALHREDSDTRWLTLARECGAQLLSRARDGAYPTIEGRLLTGYSHGASGIAYSLDSLSRATGDSSFARAARAALAYEASVYRPAERNWPDFRDGIGEHCGISWCHGAPGIALARAAMGIDPDAMHAALATTRATPEGPIDSVCCGTMGRAEILLTASEKLGDSAFAERARELGSGFLRRAEAGDTRWSISGGLYAPGFFQGAAGIGYHALRLAHPGVLPSILLFE